MQPGRRQSSIKIIQDSLESAIGEEGRIILQDNYENKQLKNVVLELDNPVGIY